LLEAAPDLDFVSLSLYNCGGWKSYDFFPKNPHHNLIQPSRSYRLTAVHRFVGNGPDDTEPHWETVQEGQIGSSGISGLNLPAVSITFLSLQRL